VDGAPELRIFILSSRGRLALAVIGALILMTGSTILLLEPGPRSDPSSLFGALWMFVLTAVATTAAYTGLWLSNLKEASRLHSGFVCTLMTLNERAASSAQAVDPLINATAED